MSPSQERSISVENLLGIRNHPRGSCGCVHRTTAACIVVNIIYMLVLYVCFKQLHSPLRQVPFKCSHLTLLPNPILHSHHFVTSKFDSYAQRVFLLDSTVFHSPEEAFHLDYERMEEEFKVFVYPDGDPETYFHTPRKLTGKYASEGYFFKNIRESRFVTDDPRRAHLFFLPISCHKMRGRVCPFFFRFDTSRINYPKLICE